MDNFAHIFFAPFIYHEVFGAFGISLLCMLGILIIATTFVRGRMRVFNIAAILALILGLFIMFGWPINQEANTLLNEQIIGLNQKDYFKNKFTVWLFNDPCRLRLSAFFWFF